MILDTLELNTAKVNLLPASTLFPSAGELPIIECITPKCRALIALQGAQLLSFTPVGGDDLLWLSPLETFAPGKAIRGGIPLCLPWFGVNRREPDLPKHGFARNQSWTVDNVVESAAGDLLLSFLFQPTLADLQVFPWAFSAQLDVRLSDSLELTLTIDNTSGEAMPLSFAMHSYFKVSAVDDINLEGVLGAGYLDNCQQLARFRQDEILRFDGEIDRVYEALGGEQCIIDGDRQTKISGSACDTVVVWNPGAELALTMSDVGVHYSDYLCVERDMAFADELLIAAGERHQSTMALAVVGR